MMTDINTVIDQAIAVANRELVAVTLRIGEHDMCGFAWAKIRPARGPVIKALRARGIGRTDDYQGGYRISSHDVIPNYRGQSITIKEEAMTAFANELRKAGVSISVGSRLD
jgi:hypothetical protein